jgi:hypothetical protein
MTYVKVLSPNITYRELGKQEIFVRIASLWVMNEIPGSPKYTALLITTQLQG